MLLNSRKRAWGPRLLCLRNGSVLGVAGEAEAVFSNGRRCICDKVIFMVLTIAKENSLK